MESFAIVAGTGAPALAAEAAADLGTTPIPCTVDRFPDGEIAVELGASVRGHAVFIVQSTAPPVNDHLMELLVLADACRRASAAHITAVVPYFGYARSDKREGKRRPITASAVSVLMESIGIDHVVTVDVHAPQIEGFFRVPIDNLSAVTTLSAALHHHVPTDAVVVSPDLGGLRRATDFSRRLEMPTAVCRKERRSGTEVSVTQVMGDVRGRPCLIVDDMITTGGTVAECVRALRAAGARPPFTVAATHGVFTPGARERLAGAGVRDIVVTDTIPQPQAGDGLRVVSIAGLLSDALRRLLADASLSVLA